LCNRADEVEIQSPSRVFHRFGEFISQGLANGIEAGGSWAQQAIGGVADGLGTVLESVITGTMSVRDAFASMLRDIAGQLARNGVQRLLGSLFGGAGLPAIPGFANGVRNFSGGLATINERGGELVALPNGTTVIPHDLSREVMQGQGGMSRVEIALGPDLEGRLLSQAQGQAIQVVRHGLTEYSRHALPDQIAGYMRDPRRRG
jgi:phage-related protein